MTGVRRNRRAGLEDLWTKDERQPDGTVLRVPSKLDGKGKRWCARYIEGKGAEHSKRFARKVDAQSWLDGQTAAVVTGVHASPAAGRVTLDVVATAWLAGHSSWGESTRLRYKSIVAKHIRPRWGSVRLADLAHDEIQEWVIDRVARVAAGGTVRKNLGVLSQICDHAVITRRNLVNPCGTVDRPKQSLGKRRYLSGVEVERLAEHAGGNWLELRHTAASLEVSQGASVLALQRMLGHDKPSTTLDFYADLFDDDLDDVAARLDSARTDFATAYSAYPTGGSGRRPGHENVLTCGEACALGRARKTWATGKRLVIVEMYLV